MGLILILILHSQDFTPYQSLALAPTGRAPFAPWGLGAGGQDCTPPQFRAPIKLDGTRLNFNPPVDSGTAPVLPWGCSVNISAPKGLKTPRLLSAEGKGPSGSNISLHGSNCSVNLPANPPWHEGGTMWPALLVPRTKTPGNVLFSPAFNWHLPPRLRGTHGCCRRGAELQGGHGGTAAVPGGDNEGTTCPCCHPRSNSSPVLTSSRRCSLAPLQKGSN